MKKPLLSVCIITYNHAPYIKEAIDSILTQEVNFDWKLIIADDYSTDGTRDILLEYKDKHPDLIELILQKNNVGPEKNWLDLIDRPKTKYVLYGEGDDYFSDKTKLQRQVDFLEKHTNLSMCFHSGKIVYEDDSRSDEIFPTPEFRFNKETLEFKDLIKHNFMLTNSVMYKWAFIDKSIKDVYPKGIMPGDWFLHILHAKQGKIGFIDRLMSIYRRHNRSLWWDADQNRDKFWRQHGSAHLLLYIEMLKLCDDEISRALVRQNINELLYVIMDVDKNHGSELIADALLKFPQTASPFINFLEDELTKVKTELEKKREEIKQAVQQKDSVIVRQENEIKSIKSSRIWKMRNVIAGLIGKEKI